MAAHTADTAAHAAPAGTAEPATHMHDLGVACLLQIFSHLSPEECASAARVHSLWRATLADEMLWRAHCKAELGLDQPALPPVIEAVDGQQPPNLTFMGTYCLWRADFNDVPWPFLLRALRAWQSIEAWLQQHAPFIGETLRRGATVQAADRAAEELGMPLPPALRAIYRVHDGQALAWDDFIEARMRGHSATAPHDHSQFHGLFGGYSMYHHICCSRMLPLARMGLWRGVLRQQDLLPSGTQVPMAASFKVLDKLTLVDLSNADVAVLAPHTGASPAPAVPSPAEPQNLNDGALRWLEEYARRLVTGAYEVSELVSELGSGSRGISLFPVSRSAGMAVAVTRGVRVRVSSVLVPESCRRRDVTYAYSVRFKLLTAEEEEQEQQEAAAAEAAVMAVTEAAAAAVVAGGAQACAPASASAGAGAAAANKAEAAAAHEEQQHTSGRSSSSAGGATATSQRLESCQLLSRHWLICDANGTVVERVSGEAVVGHYPLLQPGAAEFVYQSCTQLGEGERGSMKGHFTFVEGSIARPTGGEFDVVCPEFNLRAPEYIY